MKKVIISDKAISEFEKRINTELAAEYFYRALSNAMQYLGYFGAAEFFLKEADNEKEHYQKIVNFLNDCGTIPFLQPIQPIQESFTTLQSAFEFAFKKESELNDIYVKMYKDFEEDEPTVGEFLLFYVKEQRESVGEYGDFLATLEMCKNDPSALLLFDKELNG